MSQTAEPPSTKRTRTGTATASSAPRSPSILITTNGQLCAAATQPPGQRRGVVAMSRGLCARQQFVALAAGAAVPRCGSRSPLRVLSGHPSVLADLGRGWVVRAASTAAFTLQRLHGFPFVCASYAPLCPLDALHLWAEVSPTMGVVECGWIEMEALGAPSGAYVVGCIGANRVLVVGTNHRWAAIVDQSGAVVRHIYPGDDGDTASLLCAHCNSHWIVLVGFFLLRIWKVVDGIPQCKDKNQVPFSIFGTRDYGFSPDDDGVFLLLGDKRRGGAGFIQYVDLAKSFDSQSLVVSEELDLPMVPIHAVLSSPVHVLFQTDEEFRVHNTITGACHIFQKPSSVLGLGPDHLCLTNIKHDNQHNETAVHKIYHKSDLTTPCRTVTDSAHQTTCFPPHTGLQVTTLQQESQFKIELVDCGTGVVLVVCWAKRLILLSWPDNP